LSGNHVKRTSKEWWNVESKRLKQYVTGCLLSVFVLLSSHFSTVVAATQPAPMETIHGSIGYRERIMPPPGAEIVISLVDVAKMDVAATVIASKRFDIVGGPPWDFTLQYDRQQLDSKGRYAIQGRLEASGRLHFTSTSHIPAFSHDATKGIRIMLNRVPDSNVNTKPDVTLSNTYWKTVELSGSPVRLGKGKKELHLILNDTKKQVKGFSGCNTFRGGFKQNEQQITVGPMAATMMACMDDMEQEQRFLQALAKVKRFSISGKKLVLYDTDGQVLLRFVAVYLQ
jgi:putative lipoprotein